MKTAKKTNVQYVFVCAVFLYALFAINRIKSLGSFFINGTSINNIVYLIGLIILVGMIGFKTIPHKNQSLFAVISFLAFYSIIGLFFASNFMQGIYGIICIFLPLLTLFTVRFSKENSIKMLKFFSFVVAIYAVFVLVFSFNYNKVMAFLGNDSVVQYTNQFRISMPFGSSISTSYLFNIFIPIGFLLFSITKGKRKIIYLIYVAVDSIACLSQLSRLAVLVLALEIFFCIFVYFKSIKLRLFIIALGLITFAFVARRFDLARLSTGIFETDSGNSRFSAMKLGLTIFEEHLIFGTGVSRYYYRLWENNIINYNGISGLVDPHNLYILILSEYGIIGFSLFSLMALFVLRRIRSIQNKYFKNTGLIVLAVTALCSLGGSQLFNEINFSFVFWIVIGFFYNLESSNDSYMISSKKINFSREVILSNGKA